MNDRNDRNDRNERANSSATSTPQAPAGRPQRAAQDKDDPALQGEGNYTAARRHRESVQEFLDSGAVAPAARAAAPKNEAERREMKAAEEAGRSHARG